MTDVKAFLLVCEFVAGFASIASEKISTSLVYLALVQVFMCLVVFL